MEASGITERGRMAGAQLGLQAPWLARFATKFVLDILPAALASVIGGVLFTHYQLGHQVPRPVLEQVTPASAEMMAMVRDEHTAIMNYLNGQIVAERSRDNAADADFARAVADAKAAADSKLAEEARVADPAPAAQTAQPRSVAASAPKARAKVAVTVAAPPRAPLVIAQAEPVPAAQIAPADRLASDPNSLLAKTLDLKDHVVAVTRHAVSAIGDVFSSVGGHIGDLLPGGGVRQQFSSAS